MIFKIKIKNFMAHADTEFELSPGVTLISGPNNCGKSAIVEALRCLATSLPAKEYIRHGARKAVVTATLEDGTKLSWIRSKTSAIYNLTLPGKDPETFAKYGGKTPEAISGLLKLNKVNLDSGKEIDIHLGNQREPVFLLNESAQTIASFFASSTEAAHLVAMQKKLSTRVIEAKRTCKALKKEQKNISQRLNHLAPLPSIELSLDKARLQKKQIDAGHSSTATLKETIETIIGTQKNQEINELRFTAIDRTVPPPALFPVKILFINRVDLAQKAADIALCSRRNNALATLNPAPILNITTPIWSLLENLSQLERDQIFCCQTLALTKNISLPPTLWSVRKLGQLANALKQTKSICDSLIAKQNCLQAIKTASELSDTGQLFAVLNKISTLNQQIASAKEKKSLLSTAQAPTVIKSCSSIKTMILSLNTVTKQLAVETNRQKKSLQIKHVPKLTACSDLARICKKIAKIKSQINTEKKTLASANNALIRKKSQISALLSDKKHCPLCGSTLNQDTFVGHLT